MLETIFRSGGDRRQAHDDLRTLVQQARHERQALQAVLEKRAGSSAARGDVAVEQLAARAEESLRKAEALAGTVAAADASGRRIEQLEARVEQLTAEVAEARREAQAGTAQVADIEGQQQAISALAAQARELQELGRATERRLASLNALAEHVSHKTKALETQKHAVEHAVVEATRLNEMVWTMDAQIAKLADGKEQLQHAQDAVVRMEQLARSAAQELATATTARETFQRESAEFEGRGLALAGSLRAAIERLTVDKDEIGAFDQRVKLLSEGLGGIESRMQALLDRDATLAAVQGRADALAGVIDALATRADELARRQGEFEPLGERLAEMEALGRRTAAQHQSLAQSRQDLEAGRRELAEFHKAHGEAVQLRDRLALDRAALEAFAERTSSMLGRTPEIEARLADVLAKLALVDEGEKAAARLADAAAALDAQLARVAAREQSVQKLGERVDGLHALAADVEQKIAGQLARRTEVEALEGVCETLSLHIVDVQGKLDGVAALQSRLGPLATQVAELTQALEAAQKGMAELKRDGAAVSEQQARLAELGDASRLLSAEVAARLDQVRGAGEELGRAATVKEAVLAELAQVQDRQRDALAQVGVMEGQLERAEAMLRQLEQRRVQLQHAERSIAGFEGRLGELGRDAEAVELKIQSLADRTALVQAVKAEVDNIRQISSRSRADLQFVAEQRGEVSALRTKVEELLARSGDADAKLALIEARRGTVEEVHARAESVTHMLGDIHLNLEMLSEQRALIDDVGEKLARLDFTVQEAQNTLRALQREREVAERIEQGIKALRGRSGVGAAS